MSIPSLNPPLELADQLGAWRRSVEAKGREIATRGLFKKVKSISTKFKVWSLALILCSSMVQFLIKIRKELSARAEQPAVNDWERRIIPVHAVCCVNVGLEYRGEILGLNLSLRRT
jgi:hypothetical protein